MGDREEPQDAVGDGDDAWDTSLLDATPAVHEKTYAERAEIAAERAQRRRADREAADLRYRRRREAGWSAPPRWGLLVIGLLVGMLVVLSLWVRSHGAGWDGAGWDGAGSASVTTGVNASTIRTSGR